VADAPIPAVELARWDATITAIEACDEAAGITDRATVSARAAHTAAANGRRP
jgi:hypothetical protein